MNAGANDSIIDECEWRMRHAYKIISSGPLTVEQLFFLWIFNVRIVVHTLYSMSMREKKKCITEQICGDCRQGAFEYECCLILDFE